MGGEYNNKLLEEMMLYLNREYSKLESLFGKIKFLGKNEDLWRLVLSYWEDCKFFYESGEYVKAFELVNYIWGMLDILANLKLINIPENMKKWFKV